MTPPLVVAPATPADFHRIAQIQRLSFGPTPIFQGMFGAVTAPNIDAFNVTRLGAWLKDDTAAVMKVSRGEEILGYSYWELPHEKSLAGIAMDGTMTAPVPVPRVFAEGTHVEVALDFFRQLDEHSAMIQGRHYHLHILATDPVFQGMGVGSALLSWGEALARKDGLNIYLDATDAGLPVYAKRGYEEFGDRIFAVDGSFKVVPMVLRPAEA